tara:strand:+ start:197 stop:487 length:291 start_codon:yes stop_codon:yes gene_type:complete
MKVNNKLIQNISKLAKLKFDDKSSEEMREDLEKMIDFVNKLNEINTEGINPLIYLSDEINVQRDDVIKEEISQKDALKNAPQKDSDYFKIPKIINK